MQFKVSVFIELLSIGLHSVHTTIFKLLENKECTLDQQGIHFLFFRDLIAHFSAIPERVATLLVTIQTRTSQR